MISPPSIQRLSTCLRIVFWERFSPMKGRKYATIFSPGGITSAKPIQLRGHSSRSWQHAGSLACTTGMEWFTVEVFAIETTFTMELITILNQCHHFRGFVYERARFNRTDRPTIEVRVRPRKGSAAICSGCQQSAPGYDHLAERQSNSSRCGAFWCSCSIR